MRIAVETDHIVNLGEGQYFCEELLKRLPKRLPGYELVYHSDGWEYDWEAGADIIPRFGEAAANFALNFSRCEYFEKLPTATVVFNLDHEGQKGFIERLLGRFSKHPHWHESDQIVKVLVTHKALRTALIDKYPAVAPKIEVVGFALPRHMRELAPADSVTRRITKEVYGREQSFFLAPVTGHESDNTERLIQAYDTFRKRCSEDVTLLIGGRERDQPRTVRRAVKAAAYRADIAYLPELSEADYWKVYSSARAILYPSLSTRFPLEILRAWHARVPVMAVDNNVLQGAGAQVRGEDPKSMAEGMVALVTTPFLASGLVDNGVRRLRDFSWGEVAGRVASVLGRV